MPLRLLFIFVLIVASLIAKGHGPVHESIKRVTKEIEKNPSSASLYLERGKYYQVDRDFDHAFADFMKAKSLNSDLEEVNFFCAKLFSEHHYPISALDYIQTFLIGKPTHINGLVLRASIYKQMGEDSLSVLDFEQAISLSREPKPEYYTQISKAVLLADSTNYADAISWLEKGEEKLGFNIVLKSYALDLAKKNEDYDKALRIIDSTLLKLNRKEKWLFKKAEVEELAGRPQSAQSSYQDAMTAIQQLPVRIQRTRMVMELEASITMALLRLKE